MDNKFYIYVKTLTYLAKWGPEGGLYQSTYKMWKQSDKDFLSYCENDEVSADAAAERRLNHSIPRTYFVWGIQ